MDSNKLFAHPFARIVGFLLIILLISLILNQFRNYQNAAQTLRVSAMGQVTGIPDLATVTVGVISQAATPVEVKNSNNQKMNAIIHFLKQQGVDAKDIQTSAFYTSPRYNYVNGQNNIVGYQADQTITVIFREIDKSQAKLEKALDGVVTQGANQIQGVNFSFSDSEKLKQKAIEQAIEKAKEKATLLTSAAGLELGDIKNIMESGEDFSRPMAVNFMVKAQRGAANIEPGSQEVTESVVLIFKVY